MRPASEPRKRGRPAVSSKQKKSQTITFRTRPDLRESLEAAAEQAGRSISEEVEYRLQRSFDREALVRELYGDQHSKLFRSFHKILSIASGAKQIREGKDISEDFILTAILMLLAYSGKDIRTLLDDDVRQKNSQIVAASEIADAIGIEPSQAKARARRALNSLLNSLLG